MRVVVADDSVLLREGVSLILSEAGHEVVASAADGPSLIEAALQHRPDLILADVRMPPSNADEGLRALMRIRDQWPDARAVLLSQYVELTYLDELLADGAGGIGYLLKDRVADIAEFLRTLDRVAGGATAVDPEVVAHLMRRRPDPLAVLTPREAQVLALMAEGHSNSGIARVMTISEGAVEKYAGRVFAKLGLVADDGAHRRVRAVLTWLRRP